MMLTVMYGLLGPEHFNRVVNAAWAIASAVNVIVAAAGYLM